MIIPFQHKYPKLSQPIFTTIRGVTFGGRVKIGETVMCHTPWGNHEATVENKQIQRISDIPLSALKLDGEYPGFVINDYNDFVALVNSFRSDSHTRANRWSNVAVLTLRWKP